VEQNEISKKEQIQMDFDWRHLLECCLEEGRAVTAAQYAEHLGIARSTAARRLVTLVAYEGAVTFRNVGKNRYPKITYEPSGRGETWDYGYGSYDLPNAEAL